MTRRVYRTAQGKVVDLGAIQLQNEETRAVGNMNVNARGDLIDHLNRPVARRPGQVKKQYDRQVTNVSDSPVVASRQRAQAAVEADVLPEVLQDTAPIVDDADWMEQEIAPAPQATVVPEGGLAAAIAKARQVKQEPLKTPRQQAQSKPGVTKI